MIFVTKIMDQLNSMDQFSSSDDNTMEPIDWRSESSSNYDPLIGNMDLYVNHSAVSSSTVSPPLQGLSIHQSVNGPSVDLFEEAIDRVLVPESFMEKKSHMESAPQVVSYQVLSQSSPSYCQNDNHFLIQDMRTHTPRSATSDASLFQQSAYLVPQLTIPSAPSTVSVKKTSRKKHQDTHDGFPPKPKRCLSAYNLFFREQRKLLVKSCSDAADSSTKDCPGKKIEKNGNLGFADMARAIAARWKTISPDLKQAYEILAARDGERYDREMAVWKKLNTEREIEEWKRSQQAKTGVAVARTPKTLDDLRKIH